MSTDVDEKFVVVSKASADDADYVRAVEHPNEDSANDYLAEVKANTPWQNHAVVALDKFKSDSDKAAKAAEKATEKGEH